MSEKNAISQLQLWLIRWYYKPFCFCANSCHINKTSIMRHSLKFCENTYIISISIPTLQQLNCKSLTANAQKINKRIPSQICYLLLSDFCFNTQCLHMIYIQYILYIHSFIYKIGLPDYDSICFASKCCCHLSTSGKLLSF